MNKRLADWAYSVLAVAGCVLIGAFFLSWVKFSDGTSGLSLAIHESHRLFLIPISGALLLAAASTKSRWTRLAAIGAGMLVAGDMAFDMLRGVLNFELETWLMLGGAAVVLVGVPEERRALRGAGGLAILAGFFAPWSDGSMFHVLRITSAFGLSSVLWLIPVAGIAACISAQMTGPRGRQVALFSGLAVFASLLWFIGSVANMIFAWGAWATFGASATALVVGLAAGRDSGKANA